MGSSIISDATPGILVSFHGSPTHVHVSHKVASEQLEFLCTGWLHTVSTLRVLPSLGRAIMTPLLLLIGPEHYWFNWFQTQWEEDYY